MLIVNLDRGEKFRIHTVSDIVEIAFATKKVSSYSYLPLVVLVVTGDTASIDCEYIYRCPCVYEFDGCKWYHCWCWFCLILQRFTSGIIFECCCAEHHEPRHRLRDTSVCFADDDEYHNTFLFAHIEYIFFSGIHFNTSNHSPAGSICIYPRLH